MPSIRRFIWIGLALVLASVYGVFEAFEARQAGTMVHILNSPDLEWWAAGGMSVLGILFGLLAMAAGFGWIKPNSERPM
jgi:hypothetical protein